MQTKIIAEQFAIIRKNIDVNNLGGHSYGITMKLKIAYSALKMTSVSDANNLYFFFHNNYIYDKVLKLLVDMIVIAKSIEANQLAVEIENLYKNFRNAAIEARAYVLKYNGALAELSAREEQQEMVKTLAADLHNSPRNIQGRFQAVLDLLEKLNTATSP